jgi:hypothetical protein
MREVEWVAATRRRASGSTAEKEEGSALGVMFCGRDQRPRRHVSADVVEWRSAMLRQAGFSARLAGRLARDGDVDLHDLLRLVDRGCAPELAARILAPL